MKDNTSTLPENFEGVFYFTNSSDKEFKARWDNVEYIFPPKSRTPLIIRGATPEQTQYIRKKFAKEYAILQFYKTEKFKGLNNTAPGGTPALYVDEDLTQIIQTCLDPLPIAKAEVKVLPKDDESKYRKDRKGKNVSKILNGDEDLLSQDSQPID